MTLTSGTSDCPRPVEPRQPLDANLVGGFLTGEDNVVVEMAPAVSGNKFQNAGVTTCFETTPSFMTKLTRSVTVISTAGSPGIPTRSANLP